MEKKVLGAKNMKKVAPRVEIAPDSTCHVCAGCAEESCNNRQNEKRVSTAVAVAVSVLSLRDKQRMGPQGLSMWGFWCGH